MVRRTSWQTSPKTQAGNWQFVCEHLKYAQGKKLTPDDIYDRYDHACGVLSRTVLRQYCKKVALAEIPGATYGTAVIGGRKTGFGKIELVAMVDAEAPAPPAVDAEAPAPTAAMDVLVVQATILLNPPVVVPPEVIAPTVDPPVGAPGGPGIVHAQLRCRAFGG